MKSQKNKPETSDNKLTPRQLIHKHIQDPEHHITDEELKNLKIGPEADENIEKEVTEKLEEIKKEKGKDFPNPYKILDE